MANLAAHAVASTAVAKHGTAGASAHTGASGFDAIFAALLAQMSGTANDAGPPAGSTSKSVAELLNGSAILPATQTATPQTPAKQNAINADTILAAVAAHHSAQTPDPVVVTAATPSKKIETGVAAAQPVVQPAAPLPVRVDARPQSDLKNSTPAAPPLQTKDEKNKPAAQQAMPAADTAIPAVQQATPAAQQAMPAAQQAMPAAHTAMPAAHTAMPAAPATLVASLVAVAPPQVAAPAPAAGPAAHSDSTTATPAMASNFVAAKARSTATAANVVAELTALRTAAHQAQPQAPASEVVKNFAVPPQAATETVKTSPQSGNATANVATQTLPTNGSPATAMPQLHSLETALAALQTAQQKPAANDAASKTQPAPVKAAAPTAQNSAQFAAAVETASHQNMPVQQTLSALPAAAPVAFTAAAQTQSGDSGSGSHGSNAKPQDDRGDASPAKPAEATAPTVQAQLSSHEPVHAAASSASASAVQTAQIAQPVTSPIAASLHVAPQSAAAATDQQAIPLTNLGAIAVHIAAQSKDGVKQFNIALHPQDLGSIHVRLSVDHAGTAQAHLSADNPQTLTLLQRDAPALERALKDAGLNLAGNSLNFSLKGQDRQNGSGAQTGGRSRRLSVSAVASTGAPAAGPASIYNLAPNQVRLDIRV